MHDLIEHLPRLRRYARALTSDRYSADDLVQDTLERALSRFRLFRQGTRLDSWLMTIMHNVFVNQIRAQAARPPSDTIDEQFDEPAVRGTQGDALALRDLESALAQLPPDQREVLLLVTLEEFSYEDAARVLGIPVGTVMSRLSRGRERLRALLSGEAPVAAHLKVVK